MSHLQELFAAITSHCVINHPHSSIGISRSVLTGLVIAVFLLVGSLVQAEDPQPPTYPDAPLLSCGIKPDKKGRLVTEEGVIDLKWALNGAETFELVAASPDDPDHYQKRYTGSDTSSVLTGMREGVYQFKVRGITGDGSLGQWSEPISVKVAYMSASKVRRLLILGGLVVFMTIIAVVHGHLSHRRREAVA